MSTCKCLLNEYPPFLCQRLWALKYTYWLVHTEITDTALMIDQLWD